MKFLFNFNFIVLNSFTSYMSTVKFQGSSPGLYSPGLMVISRLGDGRLLRMRNNYSTSRKMRTCRILSQVIVCEFSTSQSIPRI